MRVDSTAPIEHSSGCYTASEFKDSPLGQIPQKWDVKTIAETAAPITNSFTDGDWIEAPHIRQQGIRLVQTGNIGVGEFLDKAEDRKFISQESFAALGCKSLQTGDVLICRLADPVGRACVVPDYIGDAITAVDVTIYRPNPKLLRSRFAMWQMNTHSALNRCDVLAGGTTRKRISRLNLGRLPLAVPKIEEQIAIEVVLDTVDEVIAKTEAVIAKLKQVRAGLLHDLLTRGLDENGQLRNPIAHPEQFQDSPLGRIPENWAVGTADNLCSQVVDCPHWTPTYVSDGIPCIRTADVQPGELILHMAFRVDEQTFRDRTVRLVPQEGDVIYSREGERLGMAAPVGRERVCLGQRVMLMRPKPETDPTYLLWTMNTFSVNQQALVRIGATTSPHVNVGDVRRFLVLVAPAAEQKQIGNLFRTMAAKVNSEAVQLAKLRSLKRALMTDLLTGRVRVPEAITVME